MPGQLVGDIYNSGQIGIELGWNAISFTQKMYQIKYDTIISLFTFISIDGCVGMKSHYDKITFLFHSLQEVNMADMKQVKRTGYISTTW